jgi:Flp pilus assembly protein TadG
MRRLRPRARDERANGMVLLIVTMPILLLSFGVGLDTARAIWIRHTLQRSLDAATVAGAAVTVVDATGDVVLDTPNALMTAKKFYALNRPGVVNCTPGPVIATRDDGTALQQCWVAPNPSSNPRVSADGKSLYFQVRETSPYSGFLRLAGLNTQTYNLISRARVAD